VVLLWLQTVVMVMLLPTTLVATVMMVAWDLSLLVVLPFWVFSHRLPGRLLLLYPLQGQFYCSLTPERTTGVGQAFITQSLAASVVLVVL